jgi:two-component system cell cycle response regulator
MDAFESVFNQLTPAKYFDAVRIIDPAENSVIKEKHYNPIAIPFPDFDIKQTNKYFDLCNSSKKPVLSLLHENEHIFLLMLIPIKLADKDLLAEFLTRVTDHVFLDDISLSDQIGLLSEINRLRQESITDKLTGLYNRRYIDERLPVEIGKCMEQKRPLSVIFADLDYYKQVNDDYGHAAGDHVLREFARVLSLNIRKDRDWIARYGGEEFMIFLSGTGSAKAKEIAERIRTAVMNKSFHFRGELIKLTCSFGVYTVDNFTVLPTVDEILDTVDKRLYQAKQLGRNIVVP